MIEQSEPHKKTGVN